MYLSCDTKKFHDNESAHILHNFWTSTHGGKLPPFPLTAPLVPCWARHVRTSDDDDEASRCSTIQQQQRCAAMCVRHNGRLMDRLIGKLDRARVTSPADTRHAVRHHHLTHSLTPPVARRRPSTPHHRRETTEKDSAGFTDSGGSSAARPSHSLSSPALASPLLFPSPSPPLPPALPLEP